MTFTLRVRCSKHTHRERTRQGDDGQEAEARKAEAEQVDRAASKGGLEPPRKHHYGRDPARERPARYIPKALRTRRRAPGLLPLGGGVLGLPDRGTERRRGSTEAERDPRGP